MNVRERIGSLYFDTHTDIPVDEYVQSIRDQVAAHIVTASEQRGVTYFDSALNDEGDIYDRDLVHYAYRAETAKEEELRKAKAKREREQKAKIKKRKAKERRMLYEKLKGEFGE